MTATPTAHKPAGGFRFIAVEQLCFAWWAYGERLILLVDLCVWFAAHELVARRCLLRPGQQVYYTYDELRGLVGGGRHVKASLRRLTTAGLLTWSPESITFPAHVPDAHACPGLWAMLGQIRNHRRLVPFPRRLLRFIAGGCRAVVIATILGHLFRCLYYRQGECRPTGLCKASWIAEVFGISLRSVKAARHYLVEDLQLLLLVEVPYWVRNRYGQKMTLNLQWARPIEEIVDQPPVVESTAEDAVHEIAPLPATNLHEFAPPDSHQKTPPEEKYQKPAAGGPAGVLTTLFTEAREALRNDTALLDEPHPIVTRIVSVPLPQGVPTAPAAAPRAAVLPPTLTHIVPQDLQETGRLLVLYEQARQRGLIGPAEADRLTFVALAQHVLTYRPANAGGLFQRLLTRRRFHFVTQDDEETALQRLKRHLYGGALPGAARARG
jgi:hypothetical protein